MNFKFKKSTFLSQLVEEEVMYTTDHKMDIKYSPSKDDSCEQDNRAKKLLLAKQQQERMIAQMNKMQTDFMKNHSGMFQIKGDNQ